MEKFFQPHYKSLLSLLLTIGIFAGCTKDEEALVPEMTDDTQDQKELQLEAPTLSLVPPSTKEVLENADNLRFPEGKSSSDNARTSAIGVIDYVDFNDPAALSIIPDYASSTFATYPYYIQKVGNAWVHVKENNGAGYNPAFTSNYQHYHLSYQNFVPCITNGGQFGKPTGSGCASINPINEPRLVNSHHGTQWLKIYAYDYNSSQRTFDLLGIKVVNGPIQLWFKKKGGGWWRWSSLGVGTWNLSSYSTEITQVLISGTGSASFAFDNVKVKMPYN
ncbi:hypothetical protein PZB74_11465 [Porifericola rhodea]|uniref:hypothetical protein n=1 Tax=Porifericola rhodea TaxID=930972 RepID=UPI002666F359|nr:hypothetical protein [Porifericola rhodea]WKN29582.1 hypothetical protein PZB74_11465 [Porifericola rhodea]